MGLPAISSKLPTDVRQFLERVREFINVKGDSFITRKDLVNAGLATTDAAGNLISGDATVNLMPPPEVSGLTVSAALATFLVEWDRPVYSNHAFTEVWRAGTNDLGQAVLVGETAGFIYSDPIGATGATRYYWVRSVSTANVTGPYNAVNGTSAATGRIGTTDLTDSLITAGKIAAGAIDAYSKFGTGLRPPGVGAALPTLPSATYPTGALYSLTTDAKLYRVNTAGTEWTKATDGADITANSITASQIAAGTITATEIAAGVLTVGSATIENGSITNAMIGDLQVDSGKISDLSAGKITTGTIAVGTSLTIGANMSLTGAGVLNSWNAVDRTCLTSGSVTTYRRVGGVEYPYQSLSHVETGTCNNATAVVLPGYWLTAPKVLVTPFSMTSYKTASSSVDQSLMCSSNAVTQTAPGSMQYTFTPTAVLGLAAGATTTMINLTWDSTVSPYYRGAWPTPANCSSVLVVFAVGTARGNGLGGWWARKARYKMMYAPQSSIAWVYDAEWTNIDIPVNYNGAYPLTNCSHNLTFPTPGLWYWAVWIEHYDDPSNPNAYGGTSDGFRYTQETLTAPDISALAANNLIVTYKSAAANVAWSAPTLTSNEGTIYEVNYSFATRAYYFGYNSAYGYSADVTFYFNGSVVRTVAPGQYSPYATTTFTRTLTGTDLALSSTDIAVTAQGYYNGVFGLTPAGYITAVSAVTKRRIQWVNNTTPAVYLQYQYATHYTASVTELASGSVSWLAIGA